MVAVYHRIIQGSAGFFCSWKPPDSSAANPTRRCRAPGSRSPLATVASWVHATPRASRSLLLIRPIYDSYPRSVRRQHTYGSATTTATLSRTRYPTLLGSHETPRADLSDVQHLPRGHLLSPPP